MPVDLRTLTRVDPGHFGAVGGRDRRADRTVALSYTGVGTQTACWEERSQVCDEIRLTLAEVRRRTSSSVPAWGPRGTTPRLTVRGTTAGAPPPPPPPPSTQSSAPPCTLHDNIFRIAAHSQVHPPCGPPYHHTVPISHPHFAAPGAFKQLFQPAALNPGPGGVSPPAPTPILGSRAGPMFLRSYPAPPACCSSSRSLQRWRRCRLPPCRPVNPRSNPRNHPRDCRNRAAGTDPGVMGIPYRGLGLITLVGTTHDTSL